MISANKLYVGGFEGFKLSEDKAEIRAWTDLIALRNLPINKLELERLKQYEAHPSDSKHEDKKIFMRKSHVAEATPNTKKKKDALEPNQSADESKLGLLNQTNNVKDATPKISLAGLSQKNKGNHN